MDFRQGTCTSCKNSFRVPATFTADKAKCPKCGGVVEIGPVQSAGGAPAAASPAAEPAAAAPKPVPAAVPPPKPAAAATPPSTPAPTPKPPTPVAKQAAPMVKPAAAIPKPASVAPAKPAAGTAKPNAPAAAKAGAPSVRSAAQDAAQKVKSGATTKPASKAGGKNADEEEPAKERRARHAPQKKSVAPALAGIGGLVLLLGAGGWYFGMYLPKQNEMQAAAKKEQAEKKRAEAAAADAAAAQKANGEAAPAGSTPASSDTAEVPDATVPKADAPAGAAKEPPKSEPEPAKEAKPAPVDDIDLSELPVLGKWSGSTDEEWAKLQEDARTYTDPSAGAAGARAGSRLQAVGRAAFPALLNEMRTIDPYTEDGYRKGDLIQKLFERICNGTNVGWKYSTETNDAIYNKKAVRRWFLEWEKAAEDEEAWRKLSKADQKKDDE